jgi:hypothetical protein
MAALPAKGAGSLKRTHVVVALALLAGACSNPKAANKSNFQHAIQDWIGDHPPCIDVPGGDVDAAGRSSSGMPRYMTTEASTNRFAKDAHEQRLAPLNVLVNAGLLKVTPATVSEQSWMPGVPGKKIDVLAYDLTDKGKAALPKTGGSATIGGPRGSLCYGKPTVDEVTQFTEPGDMMGIKASQVSYRYHLADLPDWAKDPKVRAAFPKIEQDSASSLEGKAAVVLTNDGWKHERAAKL